jgi:hypothetical protein
VPLFNYHFGTRKARRIFEKMEERSREISQRDKQLARKRRNPRDGDLLKGMGAAKIPSMIRNLESGSKTLRENSLLTLQLFTTQDFGDDAKAWLEWYKVNKSRPQHEWWSDKLGHRGYNVYGLVEEEQIPIVLKAMEDSDSLVRRAAARLLGRITGTPVKFAPDGTPKIRAWQLGRWIEMYAKHRGNRGT